MSQIKVALLVSEFFDGSLRLNNVFGGYGMLARHYIAEYLPNADISVETILGFNDRPQFESAVVDGRKTVALLPRARRLARVPGLRRVSMRLERCLHRNEMRRYLESFDVFLSVETMNYTPELLRCVPGRKLLLYIQDPRPQSDWEELDSVIGTDDGSPRPSEQVRDFYREMIREDRLIAISQGRDLIAKAQDLYRFPEDFPVRVIRNPVIVDSAFDLERQVKEDAVLFLGRLDPVKRPWLALEVARRMPQVQFYFLGRTHGEIVPYIIQPYRELPNVHLMGHQAGDAKTELLKRCKVLINTSIHEAIPISFLEALAYGTLIVSCQNPDSITERFGAFTGTVSGDGRDKADLFVEAIQRIVGNEQRRATLAYQARRYVTEEHDLEAWIAAMHTTIRGAVGNHSLARSTRRIVERMSPVTTSTYSVSRFSVHDSRNGGTTPGHLEP